MDARELGRRMDDATVRVEKMFWIAGIWSAPPRDFKEFVEDDLAEAKEVLEALPFLSDFVESDADAEEVLGEMVFRGHNGFIAKVATPVPLDFSPDGRAHSFTWGHYWTRWLYADTLEDLAEVASEWANGRLEEARRKDAA